MKFHFVALLGLLATAGGLWADSSKLDWWQSQRTGANGDARDATAEWFEAAAGFGFEFIRLSPAEMRSESKDTLIGDIDNYKRIPPADLARLIAVLDRAAVANVKIVLTVFGLPGARWRQKNDGNFDYRLWEDFSYHEQSARFWADLARALKDHPAVVGYNLLNEPHPERKDGFTGSEQDGFEQWLERNRNSPASLHGFYEMVIAAIREVDDTTPIVLDARFHANAEGFKFFKPVSDPGVLYSFHFYDPWIYTTHRINKGRFAYPDRMPTWSGDKTATWTKEDLSEHVNAIRRWAQQNAISKHRILVGEIGCDRRVAGARQYLADVIALANANDWHWAFYSFRSSSWDGMDYELGTEKLDWRYWQSVEAGKSHEEVIKRKNNPLWETILEGMQ